MTLTKLTITEDMKRKSFDYRVCDDLSEVLLKYLPIEDKLGFECVSKQFQRTIYQKHEELCIMLTLFTKMRSTEDFVTGFETLLKKLPNIKSIRYEDFGYDLQEYIDLQIDSIVKYCNKLSKINCDLSQISDERRASFASKFGQKLDSITTNTEDLEWVGKAFPKIKDLQLKGFEGSKDYIIDYLTTSHQLLSIGFKNLKKLKICLWIKEEESPETFENNFNKFIENNKCLTHFDIYMELYDNVLYDTVLRGITELDQLVYLKMSLRVNNQLINGLRQLSTKCLKLKSLSIESIEEFSALSSSFMTEFKRFKRLERLEFEFILESYEHFKPFNEYFEGMESLTHLSVGLNVENRIEKDLLKDIDICFPKLRVLSIKRPLIGVSEQTIDSLSRLSRLQSLELTVNKKSIRDSIANKVKKNSKNIKTIHIFYTIDDQNDDRNGYSFSKTIVSLFKYLNNK